MVSECICFKWTFWHTIKWCQSQLFSLKRSTIQPTGLWDNQWPRLDQFSHLSKDTGHTVQCFFSSTLLEWRKERKNECWRAKNKKFFPGPCQTLYNCHELQVRVVCRGKNLSPSCHEYLCSVLSMPSRPAPSLTLVMRRTLVQFD